MPDAATAADGRSVGRGGWRRRRQRGGRSAGTSAGCLRRGSGADVGGSGDVAGTQRPVAQEMGATDVGIVLGSKAERYGWMRGGVLPLKRVVRTGGGGGAVHPSLYRTTQCLAAVGGGVPTAILSRYRAMVHPRHGSRGRSELAGLVPKFLWRGPAEGATRWGSHRCHAVGIGRPAPQTAPRNDCWAGPEAAAGRSE